MGAASVSFLVKINPMLTTFGLLSMNVSQAHQMSFADVDY